MNAMEKILQFINLLEARHVWYHIEHIRDSIMIMLSIPGERWEVEFFPDGQIEVERFISTGKIEDETVLAELLSADEKTS